VPSSLLPLSFALACLTLAAPGGDWKDKPFPDWSDEDVLRLVTDSPWAKAKTVNIYWTKHDPAPVTYKDVPGADAAANTQQGGSPVGGIGAPRSKLPYDANVIVRWASSLPIRHAKALYKQRDEKLDPGQLNGLIAAPSPDYVVEIYGRPADVAHLGAASGESVVRGSALLRTASGRVYKPSSVEVELHALRMTVLVHFSRSTPIELSDKEVEFSVDLQVLKVKERFKLSAMRYQNHLDL
jgi:hypothetical protein